MTFSRAIRFCALVLAIAVPTVLFGQFEAATVLGTIRDASGAVVPNCKVTLENVNTGVAVDIQDRRKWQLRVRQSAPRHLQGSGRGGRIPDGRRRILRTNHQRPPARRSVSPGGPGISRGDGYRRRVAARNRNQFARPGHQPGRRFANFLSTAARMPI